MAELIRVRWSYSRAFICYFSLIFLVCSQILAGRGYGQDDLSDEEKQQLQAADRFFSVLQKTPRRGTALDRVYGHHIEFGTLDKLTQSLKDKVDSKPEDGATWLLLGLIESQRGADTAAIAAFEKAEKLRKDDALVPYYLGQSLIRIGQSEEAVLAFERALARKPARADLLEIYQQLGRVHQRAQRNQEAIQVWTRLESLFPDDARVLEQIAVTLADEGASAEAIPRYEKLAKLTKDDYRRVVFVVEAAQLKVKTGSRDQGLLEFETLLSELKPDSWLYRDVRRRIDEVFLKSGDQDSLVKYYLKWLDAHPDDVEGMTRLAKFLAASARMPEAAQWMEKAIQLAPSRADLRKAFIDQLVDSQKFPEAVIQYELLAKAKPGNTDTLRDWGKLILRDKSKDLVIRQKQATDVWNQIVALKPNDALTLAQVADLFRQSNIVEPAVELYKKAIELAPNDPQYREYLGEYQHIQKKTDEAIATWATIAQGERRNATNVARLAEVYNSFGYSDLAIEQIAEASKLDPKDFSLQLKASDYFARIGRFEDAFEYLANADKLTASDDEKGAVIQQRIQLLQSSDRLADAVQALQTETEGAASQDLTKWLLLARYLEASRKLPEASAAINKAIELDPKSVEALSVAAGVSEASGDFGQAIKINRQLADVDRRLRGDYLQRIARLHSQLGQGNEALAAAQELIVSAPGNTEHYELLAQLCVRHGKPEEGLEALRKAIRISPNESRLIVALGNALTEQLRTDEAIALYWRAFERSDSIDDKTSLTEKLVPLYTQLNQLEKLTERFERDQQDEQKRREATICLAQAYRFTGDTSAARQELESLLGESTKDTNLLQQLAKLCEENGDLDAAIGYQRQLVAIAPGGETELPLVRMLQQRGDADESNEILIKLTRSEEDPGRLLKSVDALLLQGRFDSVLGVLEPLLSQQRDNWELLYREGVAWAKKERFDEARNRFERLLALDFDHETRGVLAEAIFKQNQAKAKSNNLRGIRSDQPQRRSALSLLSSSYEVRNATELEARYEDPFGSQQQRTFWSPEVFGLSRMAALGWLLQMDQKGATEKSTEEDRNQLLVEIERNLSNESATSKQIYDAVYLAQLQGKQDQVFRVARRLAQSGGREEKQFFMDSIALRNTDTSNYSTTVEKSAAPLSTEELQLMKDCAEELSKGETQQVDNTNVAYDTNGNAYYRVGNRWVQGGVQLGNAFTQAIVAELKLAGRTEEAEKLINDQIANAKTSREITSVISYFIANDLRSKISDKFEPLMHATELELENANFDASSTAGRRPGQGVNPVNGVASVLGQWIGYLGEEEENGQIIRVVDRFLNSLVKATHRERIASSLRSKNAGNFNQQQGGNNIAWNYGKQSQNVYIDYPPTSQYLSSTSIRLLRQTFEVLKRNNAQNDLVDLLTKRVKDSQDDLKLYEQMILSAVMWWMDDKDSAFELFLTASKSVPQDIEFQFSIVSMQDSRKDLDDALNTLDAIPAANQQQLVRKERLALSLAERLGDRDRAKKAAERLFGLRIDTNAQLALLDSMRRLGLTELADAILARAESKVGNQTQSMAMLMTQMQGQGKTPQAKQLAYSILNKTKLALAPVSRRYSYSSQSNSDFAIRQQALQLLNTTGDLSALASKLDDQIQKSPDSVTLYQKLIEIYDAMGNRDKSNATLKLAIERIPKSTALRLRLASLLSGEGKGKEACDQYLEIMKTDFRLLSNDFWEIQNQFQQAGRTKELAEAIRSQNFKQLSQPYVVVNLVSEILQKDDKDPVGIELAERAFEAFPQYRGNLISQIQSTKFWEQERMFSMIRRNFTHSAQEIKSQPWKGFSDSISYSSEGKINDPFLQILHGLGEAKKREVRQLIEASIEKTPDWKGGVALLLAMDAHGKQIEKAKERAKLLLTEQNRKSIPSQTAWILGAELYGDKQLIDESTQFLEIAANEKNNGNRGMNQFQYSPQFLLSKNYIEINRKDEARKLLVSGIRSVNGQDEYSNYQSMEGNKQIATQLLQMGFAREALNAYVQLLSNKKAFDSLASWGGYGDAKTIETELRTGLSKSLESLKQDDYAEAIDQLLLPKGTDKNSNKTVQIVLDVESISKDPQFKGTSLFDNQTFQILRRLIKNKAISVSILQRLQKLVEERPDDLGLKILYVSSLATAKDKGLPRAIEELDDYVAAHPLESIPEGRKPNSRQRRECLNHIALWLVARHCFGDSKLDQIGSRLATVSLEAAKRQVENSATLAMLWEWGCLAIKQSKLDVVESKWSELLTMATLRPQRKQTSAPAPNAIPLQASSNPLQGLPKVNQVVDEQGAVVPPLTIGQFEIATQIAKAAQEGDLPRLSLKAIKESFAGGLPVPNVNPENAMGSRPAPRRIISGAIADEGKSSVDPQIGSAIAVIRNWKGDSYQASDVAGMLKEIVLSPARKREIFFGPDSRLISEGLVYSLGEQLIFWSKIAGKLDQLEEEIASREVLPASEAIKRILLGRCSMERGDIASTQKQLGELVSLLESSPSNENSVLAAHLAIPASPIPDLQERAYSILKRVSDSLPPRSEANGGRSALPKLVTSVNKFFTERGNDESIRKYFEARLTATRTAYSNYGGDYALQMQKTELANISTQSAMFGNAPLTLEYLGRVIDMEDVSRNSVSMLSPFSMAVRSLRGETNEARYKAWSDWTLPNQDRQTVRSLSYGMRPDIMPESFRQALKIKGMPIQDSIVSNLVELIDSAECVNALDSVRQAAAEAYEKKLPGSVPLKLAMAIHDKNGPDAKQLCEELCELVKAKLKQTNQTPSFGTENNLCRLAIRHGLIDLESSLAIALNDYYRNSGTVVATEWEAVNRRAKESGVVFQCGDSIELNHWSFSMTRTAPSNGREWTWWEKLNNELVHLNGASSDTVSFNYPVAGDFDFSVTVNQWNGVEFGYDGLMIRPGQNGVDGFQVVTMGESSLSETPASVGKPFQNKLRIKSQAGNVQFFVNQRLMHERKIEGSSPWIMLCDQKNSPVSFSELRLDGAPTVLKSVPLLNGSLLNAWNPTFYGESVFVPPVKADQSSNPEATEPDDSDEDVFGTPRSQALMTTFPIDRKVWTNNDGSLTMLPQKLVLEPTPSWLYYHRPILPGEKIRYEFFYQEGESIVYPSIGRTALMLSENDVRVHWIESLSNPLEYASPENSIPSGFLSASRSKVPLKAKDWNSVELALGKAEFKLTLNGEELASWPVTSKSDTRFGFFRYQHQAVSVRNLELIGNWPDKLDATVIDDLLGTQSKRNAKELQVIELATNDRFAAISPKKIVESAQEMSLESAMAFLSAWVLPSEEHSSIRLYFELGMDQLDCPADLLISIANKLGKLNELAQQVRDIKAESLGQKRARQIFLGLIAMESGHVEQVRDCFASVYADLKEDVPKSKRLEHRNAAFLLAWKGVHSKAFSNAGIALANRLLELERDSKQSAGINDSLTCLRRKLEIIATKDMQQDLLVNSDSGASQWNSIRQTGNASYQPRLAQSQWKVIPGFANHVPGSTPTLLRFQSPLTGKFTVSGELSTHGYRESYLGYKFRAAIPRHDGTAFKKIDIPSDIGVVEGALELPSWGEFAEFRLEVDGNRTSTFVNNKLIFEEEIERGGVPWITLGPEYANFEGQVRNVRITGEPQIPDSIELFPCKDHSEWSASYFREQFFQLSSPNERRYYSNQFGWLLDQSAKEIQGQKRPAIKSTKESLLQHSWPTIEDAEIEIESYYDPKRIEIHPAIGRSAWIIRQDGVSLHRLTGWHSETEELKPDNETLLTSSAKSVPLKPKDWNLIKLVIQKDQVQIYVNGSLVGTDTLREPSIERFIGLFHYANQTETRVRKVVYRGNWPKTLPSLSEQVLAQNTFQAMSHAFGSADSKNKSLDLPSIAALQGEGWEVLGTESMLQATENGLVSKLTKGGRYESWPGVRLTSPLVGNGLISTELTDLQLSQPAQGWGVNAGLFVALDDFEETELDLSFIKYQSGDAHVQALVWQKDPLGNRIAAAQRKILLGNSPNGKLAMIRKGSIFYFFYANEQNGELQLIDRFVAGAAPIKSISLQSKSSDDHGQIEIRWKGLTIRGFE